ncbi:hypothetical protein FGO68_gene4811 [Halteria grandinella]|uniref:Uncharacterized protein n=1 Tax=Halteria grandinella TaxID=5974 RepID=A0A8J8NTK9_HALGN|nr:hypothetical protein FGO68_gene4811 [Halteria grandinella]
MTYRICFFTLIFSLIQAISPGKNQQPDFVKYFNSEFSQHSQYLRVEYSPEVGMHTIALSDVPYLAPAIQIPCSYMLSYCKIFFLLIVHSVQLMITH